MTAILNYVDEYGAHEIHIETGRQGIVAMYEGPRKLQWKRQEALERLFWKEINQAILESYSDSRIPAAFEMEGLAS